jgi:putative inorganic carbon (HCO3(-)) transporter
MSFVYVWRIPVILVPGVFGALHLGIVTTGLALAAWFMVNDPLRRWSHLQGLQLIKLVLGLCVVALIGIPLALWPGRAFTFIRVTYSGLVLLLVVTAASIRSRADLERLMTAHIVGSVVLALLLARHSISASGKVYGLAAFDPNDSALLLVCTIPLAVYFIRTSAKPLTRMLAGVALLLLVMTLVRTGSRGGFLAFIATMLYLLFRFKGIPVRVRVAAIALGVVTLSLAASDKYWELMGSITDQQEDYNYTEEGGRIAIWKRGIGYMKEHPLTGVGFNNFSVAEGRSDLNRARAKRGKGWIAMAPHNSFVQMGTEAGFTGLALFVALFVVAIRACSWRAPPRASQADKDEQALARALAGALVGFCVAGFFLSQAYSAYLYSLLGMVVGLMKLRKLSAAPAGVVTPAPISARSLPRRSPRAQIARRRG